MHIFLLFCNYLWRNGSYCDSCFIGNQWNCKLHLLTMQLWQICWQSLIYTVWLGHCCVLCLLLLQINTMRPTQNGRHFPDDIFKCIFLNENVWIFVKISLKFVPKRPINNIPALVQMMAWCRPGNKPLSEPVLVSLLMHICFFGP